MKKKIHIATVILHEFPSEDQKNVIVGDLEGSLIVKLINDNNRNSSELDFAQMIREGGDSTVIALKAVDLFNLFDYAVNKDNISLKVEQVGSNLKLSAFTYVDMNNTFNPVSECPVKIIFTTISGGFDTPLEKTIFNVNIQDDIPQQDIDLMNSKGVVISAGKWGNFDITGSCKVEVKEANENVVLVGNIDKEFLF